MNGFSGITYQARLPLLWQVAEPDDQAMMAARRSNLGLLHALATIEAIPDKDPDADPAVSKAIDRLEAKLDVAIGLLSKLVAQQAEMPMPAQVSLGAHQIEWGALPDCPVPDSVIRIALHLSPHLPEPIQLYARVTLSSPTLCRAEFLDQDEEFEDWMTRTLFRYHRREVQARHQS